jgi:hypothetical protein
MAKSPSCCRCLSNDWDAVLFRQLNLAPHSFTNVISVEPQFVNKSRLKVMLDLIQRQLPIPRSVCEISSSRKTRENWDYTRRVNPPTNRHDLCRVALQVSRHWVSNENPFDHVEPPDEILPFEKRKANSGRLTPWKQGLCGITVLGNPRFDSGSSVTSTCSPSLTSLSTPPRVYFC